MGMEGVPGPSSPIGSIFTPRRSIFPSIRPLPSSAQPSQTQESSHLLVRPARQEAGAAVQSKKGLSGTHIQSPAIPAQQKGCVVGDVFRSKSEERPLFGAWREEDGHYLGAMPPTRNFSYQPRGWADLREGK